MLLAPEAHIGHQLLNVEESAGCTIEGVLAVPAPEKGAGDRDLGELYGQVTGSVVKGERHLSPTKRRPTGRPGKNHVIHPLGAHRAGRLRTKHPGHRVHHIRLAAAVRTNDHCHAGLKVQRYRVGERLEALEGQALQKHRSDASRRRITLMSFPIAATLREEGDRKVAAR